MGETRFYLHRTQQYNIIQISDKIAEAIRRILNKAFEVRIKLYVGVGVGGGELARNVNQRPPLV